MLCGLSPAEGGGCKCALVGAGVAANSRVVAALEDEDRWSLPPCLGAYPLPVNPGSGWPNPSLAAPCATWRTDACALVPARPFLPPQEPSAQSIPSVPRGGAAAGQHLDGGQPATQDGHAPGAWRGGGAGRRGGWVYCGGGQGGCWQGMHRPRMSACNMAHAWMQHVVVPGDAQPCMERRACDSVHAMYDEQKAM